MSSCRGEFSTSFVVTDGLEASKVVRRCRARVEGLGERPRNRQSVCAEAIRPAWCQREGRANFREIAWVVSVRWFGGTFLAGAPCEDADTPLRYSPAQHLVARFRKVKTGS